MISVFDLFRVGIGPSSSHTSGPMRAAKAFVDDLASSGLLDTVASVTVTLFGSLAATGRGHGTDRAVMLGLEGERPELIETETMHDRIAEIRRDHRLRLAGRVPVPFEEGQHDSNVEGEKASGFVIKMKARCVGFERSGPGFNSHMRVEVSVRHAAHHR